jgi:hypothetical protein
MSSGLTARSSLMTSPYSVASPSLIGRVQRGWAVGSLTEQGELAAWHADFIGQFLVGRFAAHHLGEHRGDAAHFGDLVHHVDGQADGLGLVGQGAFDGLFDPPSGVGGKLAAFFRIEALHRLHQADVAFRNEVGDGHSVVGVVLGDFHDQSQVGADHVGSRFRIAVLDALGKCQFLFGSEKRGFGNLPEVEFQAAF